MDMKITIGAGNSKLGIAIPCFDLPPIITCRNNAECRKNCYACKGRFRFSVKQNSVNNNLKMWRDNPVYVENVITLSALCCKYFRWHSAGDIVDEEYFKMMIRIAKKCKGTKFLCFTKKFEIVNEWVSKNGNLPKNLSVVLSAWGEWMPDNPHNLPIAYVRLKSNNFHHPYLIPVSANKCNGFCGECVNTKCSCWDLKAGQSVVFDQH